MKRRSHRYEKMARVYDDEILPVWSQRFGRMLLRDLQVPPKAMVLDVACSTGYPSLEILKRMDAQSRLIALDPIGPLLDVARKKAAELAGKRIFFRSEPAAAKLAFADDVYDLVVSNLGLLRIDDPAKALREFARVTKPGGKVIITLPLSGTYDEFYDIYREVLTKGDREEVLRRLEQQIARTPDAEEMLDWLEKAGLEQIDVEVEEFHLLFKSSREFFFAPVIEFGPLSEWKEVAGKGQEMQEIFWHIKEAIDAYFGSRAFQITVKAGCFRAIKPAPPEGAEPAEKKEPSDRRIASRPPVTPSSGSGSGAKPTEAPSEDEPEPALRDDFKLDDEEEEDTG
jgi:ubiquinone/menaquinone biosynthesis C-methylase UbiE